ncbi:MAG: hypothetical protein K940chlam3_01028 [Chlamydiae bacterium]|nr:hypothetical protein [Chlamydiota bacterium]
MIQSDANLNLTPVYHHDSYFCRLPNEIKNPIFESLPFDAQMKLLKLPLREWQWIIYHRIINEVKNFASQIPDNIEVSSNQFDRAAIDKINLYFFTRLPVKETLNELTWSKIKAYFYEKSSIKKRIQATKIEYSRRGFICRIRHPTSQTVHQATRFWITEIRQGLALHAHFPKLASQLDDVMEFEDRFFSQVLWKNHPIPYLLVESSLSLKEISWMHHCVLFTTACIVTIIFFTIKSTL